MVVVDAFYNSCYVEKVYGEYVEIGLVYTLLENVDNKSWTEVDNNISVQADMLIDFGYYGQDRSKWVTTFPL